MLKGKNVLLGVTGSIAAYKIATLASSLKKLECNVDVMMTQNATNFINPITFESLTGNKCVVDIYDICDICGWQNDLLQNKESDFSGGANVMSLNEAKKAYAEGRKVY